MSFIGQNLVKNLPLAAREPVQICAKNDENQELQQNEEMLAIQECYGFNGFVLAKIHVETQSQLGPALK